MKICVYCSASDTLDKKFYEVGREFGRKMALRGHSLVFGGYCRGIMAAVAEGVFSCQGEITAVVPDVFDREGFTFEGVTEVIHTRDMNERKKCMEDISDAFVILPGGIGTLDEFFEVFVLKSLKEMDKPVAILNDTGFFDSLVQLLDEYREKGFMTGEVRNEVGVFNDDEILFFSIENGGRNYPFIPIFNENSDTLILGSYPSVKSRETGFFYGHKQNRFWKLLARIYGEEVPENIEEKKNFLLSNNIALWDVIDSCDIEGSSDSSIKNARPCDIRYVLEKAPDIDRIFLNGKTAEKYYMKFMKDISLPVVTLPSTSPANAAWSLDRLESEWKKVKR